MTELKVTPEKLQSASAEFGNHNSTMQNLLSNMLQAVNATKSAWEGTAAMAYVTKFSALQDDVNRLNKLIQEHVTDLMEIAQVYITAEGENVNVAGGLPADVIQ